MAHFGAGIIATTTHSHFSLSSSVHMASSAAIYHLRFEKGGGKRGEVTIRIR